MHGRVEGTAREQREVCAGEEGSAREKRARLFPFYMPARAHAGFPRSLASIFLSNASRASKLAHGDASMDQGDAILSSLVASPMLEPSACPDT
jgi:hypothetical protein